MANSVDEKDGSSKPSIEASQLEPEPAVKPFSGHFSDNTEAAAKARWIYDFDGGRIGQTIATDVEKLSGHAIHWKVLNASEFPQGVEDLVHALYYYMTPTYDNMGAVNKGSTVRLDAALDGNAGDTYNGSTVITAYGLEARNENAFRTLLRPTLDSWLQQIAHDFAIQMIQDLASNSSVELPNLNPEVLVRPVYYTLQNLRPFDVPVCLLTERKDDSLGTNDADRIINSKASAVAAS
ncbi:hypothetical protein H0H93_003527 [Arthromyces matolae]|nr:hypothetical protein H0H93_003527 [Arthromyces matolae]